MRQFKRSVRIGEQILRDISGFMETDLRSQSPSMVTFTHVKVSDDLRYATVYYSCLGDEDARDRTADFLEREKKHLRALLGSNMQIRRVPELTFKFDSSLAEGIRIEQLLNEIKSESKE